MKYYLPLITALFFTANVADVYAAGADFCDGNHCYSRNELRIATSGYTKDNLPEGYYEFDEDKNIGSQNYKYILIRGKAGITLDHYKIRSYTDADVTAGNLSLSYGGLKAKNGTLNISGGTLSSSYSEINGDIVNISGDSHITLNSSELIAETKMDISGGTINATNGNLGVDGQHLSISGGTISLSNFAIYATPEVEDYQPGDPDELKPSIIISGDDTVINLNGKGYIVSNTMEELESYDLYTAGYGNIYGGTINVTKGNNYIVMDNPILGRDLEDEDSTSTPTLNIAKGATLGIWENYKDYGNERFTFFNKGTLELNEYGTINLNGGTLQANVLGNGTINVNTAGSVIDGDFDMLNLVISANTTLSQFITGEIQSFGSIHLKKGILTVDKIPEDEENSSVRFFTMETGSTLKGIGMESVGEININGGTVNVTDGIYLESHNNSYGAKSADMNINGGNITIVGISDNGYFDSGEITLVGGNEDNPSNLNISGADTVINMNFDGMKIHDYEDGHDGGILHEGKSGDINISGGTINLTGQIAKINRGGYDGDWIYDYNGNALMLEDDFHDITGKWLTYWNVTDQDFIDAGLNPQNVDRNQYHVSSGDINISGGTINLKNGARISTTYKNTGDINITGGTIKTIKTSNLANNEDAGRILHYGAGDINIKGSAVINMERGNIQKGNHGDDSERTEGNINIGENAQITAFNDTHINSDQDVNISGGTITLYNDATVEGYGDFIVSNGNITVGKMTETPCWECDTWSAIGSVYKDGKVKISGGNITLNNNAALNRSVHIDDDMNINELDGSISGNLEITGGTVTANGNSIILLGWGDGTDIHGNDLEDMIANNEVEEKGDIIIGGDSQVTLNDDAQIIHDAIGEVKLTGGVLNLNGRSSLRAERNGVITMTGGELNLAGQAQIYADNNFHNPVAMTVNNGAVINAAGSDNRINNNIEMDNSNINVASGAVLTVQRNSNNGLINMSGKSGINLSGTLNANIDGHNGSGLVFEGTGAKLNGNAVNLSTLDFDNANTSFGEQMLSANSITLNNSTLTFNGDVIMTSLADDITLSDDSLIRVKGTGNVITSAHDILLDHSDLEIKSGASLELNVGNDGHVVFEGGNIYLQGTLTGNVIADELFIGGDGIIYGGRYDSASIDGKSGNVSAFVTDKLNVGNLNIINNSNITLDKANTLIVDEADKRKYAYGTGYYKGKRYTVMEDQNEFMDQNGNINYGEIDDGDVIKDYENQIQGTLKIDNSTLNLKTNLAADKFVVDNNATLNAQNQIIGGNSLLVDHGSTVNLQHTTPYIWNESGFTDSIVVNNGSVLNLTTLDIGSNWRMTDYVNILNGSTLNLTDDGFKSSQFLVDNSTLKAKNADFGAKYNDGNPAAVFNHATLDMDNSYSYTHGITGLYDDTEATLTNKSALAANEMEIENSTVTANNSHVGAFKYVVKVDMEDDAIYNYIDHGLSLNDQTDLTVSDSTITLNGNSELGVAMAIVEDDDVVKHIIGYVTPEIMENPELLKQLNSKYKNYKLVSYQNYDEDHEYDFEDGFDEVADYKAQVNISGSDIEMNGTAKIVNAMLNIDKEGKGSGDVIISDDSTVEVNGNNTISASHKVRVYDSTVVVNNGATLNVESSQIKAENEDKDISTQKIILSDSAIELSGTLNADIEGKGDSVLQISGNAVLNGNADGLTEIQFDKASTSLNNQSLDATDITLDNSTVNILGGVDIYADNRLKLSNGSTLNVKGKDNSIYAGNSLELTNSNIIIKKASELDFNIGNGGTVNLNNGHINMYEGSTLTGNIRNAAQINILTGPSSNEDYIASGDIARLSSIIDGYMENLGDLYISGSKNMNIDKDGLFILSEDDQDYARIYATGFEGRKRYYADGVNDGVVTYGEYEDEKEHGEYYYDDDDEEIRKYENQIIGTLSIQDSNVTMSTNFAAEDIEVDNSTLNVTDHIIGGSNLNIGNGSKVTLLGKSTLALSGFDTGVTVDDGSTLTTGYFQIGAEDSENETDAWLRISDNSTYNVSNGEAYIGVLSLSGNSTVNATNSRLKAVVGHNYGNYGEQKERGINIDASTLNASGAFVQSEDDIFVTGNDEIGSTVNLKAKSTLMADENMDIYNSTVIADNSDIGAFKHTVKIDAEDKEVNHKLEHGMLNSCNNCNLDIVMDVKDSDITLKGNSRLGVGLAITNWKSGTQGVIEGFVTRDLLDEDNAERFLNNYRSKGYDIEEEDFENGFADAMYYQGYLTIDGGKIVMEGSSSIVNNILNVTGGNMSGDVQIYGSEIEVKGNNTTISAAQDIKLTSSELNILRGAVLNIISDTASAQSGKKITLDGTKLDLAGVINGDVYLVKDSGSSLTLNGGRVAGSVNGLSSLAFGAGQSGKTSATLKGMTIADITELTLAGETVNGKVSAPNVTLDSALFTMDDDDASRRYYAYDKKAKGYINLGTWEYAQNYDNDDRYDVLPYDNQITGDVNLSDGAVLTLNSALAADKFNLHNAILTVSNARIDGSLYLDDKSTATINGGKTSDVSLGIVDVKDNSTLNLNSIDWMGINSLTAEDSKLNLSGTDLDPSGAVKLTNTTTNLTSSVMWENDENNNYTSLIIDGGTLNASASTIGFSETTVKGDAKVTASKGSLWTIGDADINNAVITLNDTSKIYTAWYDNEDVDDNSQEQHWAAFSSRFDENTPFNIDFTNSKLNLNGSSVVKLAVVGETDIDVDLHGNIWFENSEVNMNGTTQIVNSAVLFESEDDIEEIEDLKNDSGNVLFNSSVLNVKGKNNTIAANGFVSMMNSELNIAKGATLTVKSYLSGEEVDPTIYVTGTEIKLGGVLDANLVIEDVPELSANATSLSMEGGRVNGTIIGLNEVRMGTGQNGSTSATMKGTSFGNIKNLTVAGSLINGRAVAPKITLNSSVFKYFEEYDDGNRSVNGGTAYCDDDGCVRLDEGDDDDTGDDTGEFGYNKNRNGDNEPDTFFEDTADFENVILGDVNVEEKAQLTVNTSLAARNIIVDNATLTSNNGLLYGNLKLDNNAVVTINGNNLEELSLGSVNLQHDSTLNLNSVEYMIAKSIEADSAKLNINKWTELYTNNLNLTDTKATVSAGGAWIKADIASVDGGSLTVADADISFTSSVLSGTQVAISKNTLFGVGGAIIEGSTVTVNDKSKIVTDFTDVDKDNFSGNVNVNEYFGEYSAAPDSSIKFYNSVVNLNGSSSIERNVVYENENARNRGELIPANTSGMQGDIVFGGSEEYQYDEANGLGTVVNMAGTSAIVNMADGNIIFDADSVLNAKGKNTVTAQGQVAFNDSTLNVAQGASLTVDSSDNKIHLDNAIVVLSGMLNADLTGTIDTFVYGAKGLLNGSIMLDPGSSINSFGVSGANAKSLSSLIDRFDSTDMVTFLMVDKSNLSFDDLIKNELEFDNVDVTNATFTISGDKDEHERVLNGSLTASSGATIKINNGTEFILSNQDGTIDLHDSSLTVAGAALRKGQEAGYQTLVAADGGIWINNTGNDKATVSISNAIVSGDLNLHNVGKATLTNVDAYGDITVSGNVTQDRRGNNVYKTATLTEVASGGNLDVKGAKAVLQKNNYFDNTNVNSGSYLDIKGDLYGNLTLAEAATADEASTAALAAGKYLHGDVQLSGGNLFIVQGIVDGDVAGSGTLQIANGKAKINGTVNNAAIELLKLKTSLSSIFQAEVNNFASTTLTNSVITADISPYAINIGGLNLAKSTLTLQGDMSADSLSASASTINLGTNALEIAGDAFISNGTKINIQVADAATYGHIDVGGILVLASDAKGNKPSTNLAVTLQKGIVLAEGNTFNFLNYGEDEDVEGLFKVEGQLNRVTIANNRYTFKEENPGQFIITDATSGKGVVRRYDSKLINAMRAATALVDSDQTLSGSQSQLAENLNTLSQIEGGEGDYIQALNATGPDDNNMVTENTVSTVNTVIAAVSDQTGSAGISSSAQGMSSGDELSGMTLWTKVLYNQGKLDNTAAFDGFKSRMRGLAMGGDKKLNKEVKLGLGYAYTKGKITNGYRRSDVDTHTLMLYGEYKPSAWFVDAVASYGWSDYESKAYSVLGTTKSDFDVYAAAVQLNTGYDINVTDDTVLTPVAGMRYTHIKRDAYSDSDDKRIAKSSKNIVTALAGAKLKKNFELNAGTTITPEARLGFTYDVKRDADDSVVKLSNGSSYEVEGRSLHRFALEAGAGVTATFDNGIELTVGYEGRFRKDYRDHTGLLNCNYKF